jgi:hypothetical protein
VEVAWAVVCVEVTGELTGSAELGGSAQRAGWGRHGRQWRKGQVGAARVAQRVGAASGHQMLGLERLRFFYYVFMTMA